MQFSGIDALKIKLTPIETQALAIPRQEELSPTDKYYVETKKNKYGYQPITWLGHWAKTPHHREYKATAYHYKPVIEDSMKNYEFIEGNRRLDTKFKQKGTKKYKKEWPVTWDWNFKMNTQT